MATVVESSAVITPEAMAQANEKQAAKKEPLADAATGAPADGKVPEAVSPAEEDEIGLTAEEREGLTGKMLKAIGKKHRAMREAEEFGAKQYSERKLAEQRAEEFQQEAQRYKEQLEKATKPDPDADKPVRADFDSDEKYTDAVIDWKVDKRAKEREAAEAQRREQERQNEIVETAKSRIAKAVELKPNWHEVMDSMAASVDKAPAAILSYLQESELIAELSWHLVEHQDEAERIYKLPVNKQLFEIAKIESRLSPFSASSSKSSEKGADSQTKSDKDGHEPSKTVTPSKPRAAVITPLNSSLAQVEKPAAERDAQEATRDFQKKTGIDLYKRQRH